MATEEPDLPPEAERESWQEAVAGSAIVQTLAAMVVVSALAWTLGRGAFVLAAPFARPWTLLTSVYAHDSIAHLVANAVVILTAGTVVAYGTSTARFHAFVIATGAIAGLSQVFAAGAFGWRVGVLGISGAGFALVGYLLAANPVSARLADRIPLRAGIVVVALLAGGLTVLLSGTNSAVLAHFTGAVLGLVAGRYRIL